MKDTLTYVTAAEAGITEINQIKIVLEMVLSQGGLAVMPQIYDAIEKRLGDGVFLSEQGQHSLRRTVNTSAVERGYIYPYDSENPGWRITDEGVRFIRQELGQTVGEVKVTARAYINFQLALKEIRSLLDFYDRIRANSSPRDRALEVFKKTGIILAVTAWETFIEDIFESYVGHLLDKASSPDEMQRVFNTVAKTWYEAILKGQDNHPKPDEFIKWTGDNWKQLVRNRLLEDLANLNTPKSKNIRDLSKRYLGIDITESWRWGRSSPDQVRRKLNELIELRGELAHRIGNYFESGTSVRRDRLVKAIDFIERLAECTDTAINELQ